MKPWEILGQARAPDATELTLIRHPSEYLIVANGQPLMSSRTHDSEDALGALGCRRARTLAQPVVLVGGLGMGFTLRAALDVLPSDAIVRLVELVPAVVQWNRGPLGALARHPIDDPRVRVEEGDVGAAMRAHPGAFDAVLLDVDNGPAALTASSNRALYDDAGLALVRASLAPNGVCAVWCARDEHRFEARLRTAGFRVQRERVNGRTKHRGSRHTILLAHGPDAPNARRPIGRSPSQVL